MNALDEAMPKMWFAIEHGDVDEIAELLERYPGLEQRVPNVGGNWLQLAAALGQIPSVAFWLERGVDVNLNAAHVKAGEGEFTALHLAKDAAMTRYLLERGARVNVCHRLLGTPLHYAVSAAQEPSQKGRRREGGADLEQLRVLVEAGADLSLMNGENRRGYTPLGWAIHTRRRSAEAFLRSIGAPETGVRPNARAVRPLDLRKERDAVYKYVMKSARSFKPSRGNVLGEPGSVRLVHVGFEYAQAAWVIVVFDMRLDAKVDGEWTSLIDDGMWERPRWLEACEENQDEPISIVQLDGTKAILPAGTEMAKILGEVVKAAVLQARADGAFRELPKAPGCEFNIEHLGGAYAWPADEAKTPENLLEPA